MNDSTAINRANWDERAPAASAAYGLDRYLADPEHLSDVVRFDEGGTYVETDVRFTHTWNHGLGDVVTALLRAGLRLTDLVEHDSVPWEAIPGRLSQGPDGEWRLSTRPERLAASYTLQAVKE